MNTHGIVLPQDMIAVSPCNVLACAVLVMSVFGGYKRSNLELVHGSYFHTSVPYKMCLLGQCRSFPVDFLVRGKSNEPLYECMYVYFG